MMVFPVKTISPDWRKLTRLIAVCLLPIIGSCEKSDDLVAIVSFDTIEPVVTITGIETGGNVTANRNIDITEYGVVYNTAGNPTIEGDAVSPGIDLSVTEVGSRYLIEFDSRITVLSPGATYYIKAYISTRTGTAYGNQVSYKVN
jgi:hypothetical protein